MGRDGPVKFDPNDENGILTALQRYEDAFGQTFERFSTVWEAEMAAQVRSLKGGVNATHEMTAATRSVVGDLGDFSGGLGSLAKALEGIGGGSGGGGWFSGLLSKFGGQSGALSHMLGISPAATAAIAGGATGLFADGAAFNHGNVIPFASGGIVNHPTLFPMANGAGLMGEAGPEAIMPLRRGADGKLGVAAANQNGSSRVVIDVNVSVDDDGKLSVIARQAGAQGGQEQADIRINQYDAALPDRVAGINRNPRRR